MKLKKKLLLLCLGILTIFWLIASYQHVRAYNQMEEEDIERLGEELVKLLDYEPVWLYGLGKLLLTTGLLIAIGWVIIIFETVKKAKKRTKGKSKLILLCMLLFLIISGYNTMRTIPAVLS